MNKRNLHQQIIDALLARYNNAKWAAKQAHDAATNEESVAENKYDTFGLEASYLAHGQSQRVLECEADWQSFVKAELNSVDKESPIKLWSLVSLAAIDSPNPKNKHFFLSPCAGGLRVDLEEEEIFLVTPSSPVGKVLLGRSIEDEVTLMQNGQQTQYEILDVC
ncbi:GreA/GreB family elongation factor [Marinomonas sp. A79]|uniref:GreA/GreB family elongation factor n=1 Tax=Marinomonas vulgaris TaxID=2823372 RepID=A0ABS5H9Y4_9GAMM|nr:GreA/GreB family elongation factor [Marinomonas vulgaris]MBR7888477.1 GreA/GreB family elongation factor [Marinomonas vulgaris]